MDKQSEALEELVENRKRKIPSSLNFCKRVIVIGSLFALAGFSIIWIFGDGIYGEPEKMLLSFIILLGLILIIGAIMITVLLNLENWTLKKLKERQIKENKS